VFYFVHTWSVREYRYGRKEYLYDSKNEDLVGMYYYRYTVSSIINQRHDACSTSTSREISSSQREEHNIDDHHIRRRGWNIGGATSEPQQPAPTHTCWNLNQHRHQTLQQSPPPRSSPPPPSVQQRSQSTATAAAAAASGGVTTTSITATTNTPSPQPPPNIYCSAERERILWYRGNR
jgi:hypothetical protein